MAIKEGNAVIRLAHGLCNLWKITALRFGFKFCHWFDPGNLHPIYLASATLPKFALFLRRDTVAVIWSEQLQNAFYKARFLPKGSKKLTHDQDYLKSNPDSRQVAFESDLNEGGDLKVQNSFLALEWIGFCFPSFHPCCDEREKKFLNKNSLQPLRFIFYFNAKLQFLSNSPFVLISIQTFSGLSSSLEP